MKRALPAAVALLVALALLPGVAAADSRTGGTVVVGADEVVDGDLRATGGTVVVRGEVTGDLEAVAGSVVVEGTVGGDVNGSAGAVRVDGDVGGTVNVGAGSVYLAEGSSVGDLNVGAGSVVVAGTVAGDARVGAEEITLADTAVVEGDFVYDGDLTRADGAQVAGEVREDPELARDGGSGFDVPSGAGAVYGVLATLAAGAALLFLFPRFADDVAAGAAARPLRTGGVGLLALIAIPLVCVAAMLTVVGVPLGLVGLLLYAVFLLVAAVYGDFVVGSWALSYAGVESRWAALVAGVVGLALVGLVPYLGGIVGFLAFLLGLGSVSAELWERFRAAR